MEVLGIGPLELMVIGILALLVIKPENWGKTGRTIASGINKIKSSDAWRAMNESWRAASEFSSELRREANLEKSFQELDEFAAPASVRRKPAAAHMPPAPKAGEPETNVIHPPRSAPYMAAQMIKSAPKKTKASAKADSKKSAKNKPKPAPAKRKPKKSNA